MSPWDLEGKKTWIFLLIGQPPSVRHFYFFLTIFLYIFPFYAITSLWKYKGLVLVQRQDPLYFRMMKEILFSIISFLRMFLPSSILLTKHLFFHTNFVDSNICSEWVSLAIFVVILATKETTWSLWLTCLPSMSFIGIMAPRMQSKETTCIMDKKQVKTGMTKKI